MANIQDVIQARKVIRRLQFVNREILDKYNNKELSIIWNGVGPDWAPGILRAALSTIYRLFLPATLIHDVEWHEGTGKRADFAISNDVFLTNMKKILDDKYPFSHWWLWPLRARWYRRMIECYKAVGLGFKSYCAPCECTICEAKRKEEEYKK